MELTNEFKVPVPIEKAWEVLTDLKVIAPCLPGAELVRVKNGEYEGSIKVKVGPIITTYSGIATWVDRNHKTYTAILKADGKESKGTGSAAAVVHATLKPIIVDDGNATKVSVTTNLSISGKVAQLGRGLLDDVSGKLLDIFAANLSNLLNNIPIDKSAGLISDVETKESEALIDEEKSSEDGNISFENANDSDNDKSDRSGDNDDLNSETEINIPTSTNDSQMVAGESEDIPDTNPDVFPEDVGDQSQRLVGENPGQQETELSEVEIESETDISGDLVEADINETLTPVQNAVEPTVELSESLKEKLEMVRRDIDDARKGIDLEVTVDDGGDLPTSGEVTDTDKPKLYDLVAEEAISGNDRQELSLEDDDIDGPATELNTDNSSKEEIVLDKLSKLANDIDFESEIEQVQLNQEQHETVISPSETTPVDEKLSRLANSVFEEDGADSDDQLLDPTSIELDVIEAEDLLEALNSFKERSDGEADGALISQDFVVESKNSFEDVEAAEDDTTSFNDEAKGGLESENIVELQIPDSDTVTTDSAGNTNGEVIPIFKASVTEESQPLPTEITSETNVDLESDKEDNQELASIIEMSTFASTDGSSTVSTTSEEIASDEDKAEDWESPGITESQNKPNDPIDILDLVSSPLKNRLKPLVVPSVGVLLLLILRHILKSKNPNVD